MTGTNTYFYHNCIHWYSLDPFLFLIYTFSGVFGWFPDFNASAHPVPAVQRIVHPHCQRFLPPEKWCLEQCSLNTPNKFWGIQTKFRFVLWLILCYFMVGARNFFERILVIFSSESSDATNKVTCFTTEFKEEEKYLHVHVIFIECLNLHQFFKHSIVDLSDIKSYYVQPIEFYYTACNASSSTIILCILYIVYLYLIIFFH